MYPETVVHNQKVVSVKRLRNSPNGSPSWFLTFEDGSSDRIKPNAMLSYMNVDSWAGRSFTVTYSRNYIVDMVESGVEL